MIQCSLCLYLKLSVLSSKQQMLLPDVNSRFSGLEGQSCHLLRQRSPRIDVFRLTWNVTMVLTMPPYYPQYNAGVSRKNGSGSWDTLTVWPSRWSSNQNWFTLIFRHSIWSKQRQGYFKRSIRHGNAETSIWLVNFLLTSHHDSPESRHQKCMGAGVQMSGSCPGHCVYPGPLIGQLLPCRPLIGCWWPVLTRRGLGKITRHSSVVTLRSQFESRLILWHWVQHNQNIELRM